MNLITLKEAFSILNLVFNNGKSHKYMGCTKRKSAVKISGFSLFFKKENSAPWESYIQAVFHSAHFNTIKNSFDIISYSFEVRGLTCVKSVLDYHIFKGEKIVNFTINESSELDILKCYKKNLKDSMFFKILYLKRIKSL